MARFRRGKSFDGQQDRAQGAVKFELLSLTFAAVRQQCQLVQGLLKLRSRFGQRRMGRGFPRDFTPIEYRSLSPPGFAIVARQYLGLAVDQLREMRLQRFRDPAVQLLSGIAQQAAIGRFLYQHVLEGIDRIGWCAALIDQLGRDQPAESSSQLLFGETGDRA